jgi:hypothetical protein
VCENELEHVHGSETLETRRPASICPLDKAWAGFRKRCIHAAPGHRQWRYILLPFRNDEPQVQDGGTRGMDIVVQWEVGCKGSQRSSFLTHIRPHSSPQRGGGGGGPKGPIPVIGPHSHYIAAADAIGYSA